MAIIIGLFITGIIIILGLLSQYIFKKTKIPGALILIIFGASLSYLDLVNIDMKSPELNFLIIFSLIYVVFYGALPIKLQAIFSTMKYAFSSSIMNFILITGLIGLLSYVIGFGWVTAFSLAALFCVMDGAIINSMLDIIKISDKAKAQIQLESAVVDTIVIISVLSLANFVTMNLNEIITSLSNYLFLSFGIGLIAAVIWTFALRHVGDISSAPIATMAILVLLYAFAEYTHANGVITVFSFSIIMGNVALWKKLLYKQQKTHTTLVNFATKSFFRDLSFLIRTFLFVYLGILVDISQWPYLLIGLCFFILSYAIRSFLLRFASNPDIKKKERYLLEAMAAKGLTPIVLLAVIGVSPQFTHIVIGGIFFSVLISSIMITLIEKKRFTSVSEIVLRKRN